MNVIFRPLAVEDIAEAATWYEARSPGLGDELIDEILAATRRAQQNPELFRVVHREGNVRRVLQVAFLIESFSLLLTTYFTFTQFFTAQDTIAAG